MYKENKFYDSKIGAVPIEWDEIKFSDIFEEVVEFSNDIEKLPIYSLTIEDGVTPKTERYERSFLITKDKNNYKVVKKDEFVFNPMNLRFGAIAKLNEDKKVLVSGYYNVFKLKKDYSPAYIECFLKSERMINLYNRVSTGSLKEKQRVHFSQFIEFKLPLPPVNEANKIAAIITTWDKAIELKEKLIELKKEQKKGLMQKLLTGEVRLPGFNGEWKEVRIKDLGILKGGSAFPEKFQNEISGEYPFFKVSDMNNKENDKYLINANNYINEEIRSKIKATIIPKNSIVFAKVGAALLLERKRILVQDSCIDNNMMALIVKDNINFNYVYYLLLNLRLSKFSNVGALPSLNSNDVYGIKCKIPMDYNEQTAIGDLLKILDKEISLLKNELLQIKQQKKGLMQLLLTGKVRVQV